MKKILFISISFPPKKDSESIQAGKYFKYLLKTFPNIYVLTSASPTLNMPLDKTLKHFTEGVKKAYEIILWENRYLNFVINRLFPFLLQLPDSKWSFPFQWKKAARKIDIKPDVIYSRSYPISSSLMGLKMKKYYKVPWILHLSDPWTGYPLTSFSRFSKRYNQNKELETFAEADKICFTSLRTVEIYSEKYPEFKEKFEYFPNVYDDEQVSENKHSFKDKLRFVYTGGMIQGRSPIYLFNVLELLGKREPELLQQVEFIFAGETDRRNRSLFNEFKHLQCVKYLGALTLNEAIELQKSADILIVIDNPLDNKNEAVFFPSKVLDYIIARRKILAITNSFSVTYEVVENKLGDCFDHYDGKGIENYILNCLESFRLKRSDQFFLEQVDHKYSASFQAARLSRIIKTL